jgi:hypothetical protein
LVNKFKATKATWPEAKEKQTMDTIEQTYDGLRDKLKAKNPALVELITQAAASFEVKCNMCEAGIKGDLTVGNFQEKHGKLLPESHKREQVQESDPLGLTNIDEAKRDYAVLFGVEPRAKANKKEAKPAIRKHNGTVDNFNEKNPFNGDRQAFSENDAPKNIFTKGDRVLYDWLRSSGKITEAEHAKLLGKKPEGYEQLSEQQRKDFDFARLCGISEADSFRVARMTGSTFKESRR